ncbi:MAG: nucleotidyltransferase domain-containing protein [Candidatus Omnitrophica bacterium]|nr:nucleotidyltransferase domain-containing protein [Candidatus Omnitrophota bacterium]
MSRKSLLEQELRRMIRVIVREYKPERIILFGSLAQGTTHEWSDIDLAIVKDTRRQREGSL